MGGEVFGVCGCVVGCVVVGGGMCVCVCTRMNVWKVDHRVINSKEQLESSGLVGVCISECMCVWGGGVCVCMWVGETWEGVCSGKGRVLEA